METTSQGWRAIDDACAALYPDQRPRHVAFPPGRALGGVLQGASTYRAGSHWHYVTYGLSNLWDDPAETTDGYSGWGYELTWRVQDLTVIGYRAPDWPFTMLLEVARWSAQVSFLLTADKRLHLHRPVTGYPKTAGPATDRIGLLLTIDSDLGSIETANGRVDFLQLVAATAEDMLAADTGGQDIVLGWLREEDPLLRTVVG